MVFAINNGEDLDKLEELASIQDQVKVVRLQDKLGKQNFYEVMKKVFEPVTKSVENNLEKKSENLNNKLLQIMSDRGIISSYLISPLFKITNPENTSQFKLVKDPSSNRFNDLKIHNSIPIILYGNILTFRDTGKEFELKGDLLEMITNKDYIVDLVTLSDKNLMYDFAKEMNFDLKAIGKKSTRDKSLIKLLKKPS